MFCAGLFASLNKPNLNKDNNSSHENKENSSGNQRRSSLSGSNNTSNKNNEHVCEKTAAPVLNKAVSVIRNPSLAAAASIPESTEMATVIAPIPTTGAAGNALAAFTANRPSMSKLMCKIRN
jgi:hypothetical protein